MNSKLVVLSTLAAIVFIISIIVLSLGIKKQQSKEGPCVTDKQKLFSFLQAVQKAYYQYSPNKIIYAPDSTVADTRSRFKPYDCSPAALKDRTDAALRLYRQMEDLKINTATLNTRERKSLAQMKHYLKTNFGTPFDENYYIGDWMLGPNNFCWQSICYIGSDLLGHFNIKSHGFQPKTEDDLTFVLDTLKKYGESINQYIKNMKMGVAAGMVRSQEQCKAGIDSIKGKFPKIDEKQEKGVLEESFVTGLRDPVYFGKMTNETKKEWKQRKGKTVTDTIDEHLVQYIGKPVSTFLKYLINEHYQHCTPSAQHSGLATLPLDYVWVGGKEDTSRPTTKKLPTGEVLNGKKAYEAILPYFSTVDMSPDEIYNLGQRQLKTLYPRALKIAKHFTGESDDAIAATKFKSAYIDSSSAYFNSTPIPANETGETAHRKCKSMVTAKQYCPVRYEAMLSWFDYVQTVLAKLDPKTIKFFYFTGNKSTTPNCPLKMKAKFNPSSGSQSYRGAGSSCSRPCYYMLPFWLTPPGARYNAISVGVHEGRPGHHTQVQGFHEHFASTGGGTKDVIDWLSGETYYTAFTEGWALYAENPLMAQGTDIYEKDKLQEYGMLKWQIWRALRLMIDTGLHYKGMKRQEALDLFEKYAWDTSDKAIKDVTRYQSSPGQATAYMIGQLAIWRLRNYTIETFKANKIPFSEKEFHFYLLSQGSAPLSYLESFMKDYVSCRINPFQDKCVVVLNPLGNKDAQSKATQHLSENKPMEPKPYDEHYD